MNHVYWSDEDGAYLAICDIRPGCSAVGATEDEALRELLDAQRAWEQAKTGALTQNDAAAPRKKDGG